MWVIAPGPPLQVPCPAPSVGQRHRSLHSPLLLPFQGTSGTMPSGTVLLPEPSQALATYLDKTWVATAGHQMGTPLH